MKNFEETIKGARIMTKKDYELILEISNSEFPLIDFVNDLRVLKRKGRLEGFDYEGMQNDLVKIAKLFKYYYDKAIKGEMKNENDNK